MCFIKFKFKFFTDDKDFQFHQFSNYFYKMALDSEFTVWRLNTYFP